MLYVDAPTVNVLAGLAGSNKPETHVHPITSSTIIGTTDYVWCKDGSKVRARIEQGHVIKVHV